MKEDIARSFRDLQDRIVNTLEKSDGQGVFRIDDWDRPGGGGGRTRVIQNGDVIEKGGVNFSKVHGTAPEMLLKEFGVSEGYFFATGVSIVLHPKSPMIPIIHMNVRYFEMSTGHWWFGGGIDLTPHYIDRGDAKYFHHSVKEMCDRHDPSYYPKFKTWADNYFYLPHRKETRGIGGIFFDRLTGDRTKAHEFTIDLGNLFAPLYTHFMNKNRDIHFGDRERKWQMIRRGRYVEFNLVWDRGTKFGLETDGRTESILMSLPPLAGWEYDFNVEPKSKEAETLKMLKKDINWLA